MDENNYMLKAFGALAASAEQEQDRGASFPNSDAEDLSSGARFIPGQVTMVRRQGGDVEFIQDCKSPLCWYWEFQQDVKISNGHVVRRGTRIYHWERSTYERTDFEDGSCPQCGNEHIEGGTVEPPERPLDVEVLDDDKCPDCGQFVKKHEVTQQGAMLIVEIEPNWNGAPDAMYGRGPAVKCNCGYKANVARLRELVNTI